MDRETERQKQIKGETERKRNKHRDRGRGRDADTEQRQRQRQRQKDGKENCKLAKLQIAVEANAQRSFPHYGAHQLVPPLTCCWPLCACHVSPHHSFSMTPNNKICIHITDIQCSKTSDLNSATISQVEKYWINLFVKRLFHLYLKQLKARDHIIVPSIIHKS